MSLTTLTYGAHCCALVLSAVRSTFRSKLSHAADILAFGHGYSRLLVGRGRGSGMIATSVLADALWMTATTCVGLVSSIGAAALVASVGVSSGREQRILSLTVSRMYMMVLSGTLSRHKMPSLAVCVRMLQHRVSKNTSTGKSLRTPAWLVISSTGRLLK